MPRITQVRLSHTKQVVRCTAASERRSTRPLPDIDLYEYQIAC